MRVRSNRSDPIISIRMPEAMKIKIVELASKSGRSVNAEILVRLSISLKMIKSAMDEVSRI